jgi:hypothetical protein
MNDRRIDPGRFKLDWDDARTERLLAGVQAHVGRQRRMRRAALASAALASLAVVAFVSTRGNRGSIVATPAASAPTGAAQASLRLDEGSEIGFDPATSAVRVVEQSASRVRVEAVRGPARYSVVARPGRTFEVRSGSVIVRVVGTEFLVEPRGDATWVEVSRGKVEVSWGAGAGDHTVVAAGASGLYPPAPAEHAAVGAARAVAAPEPADAPVPHGQPPGRFTARASTAVTTGARMPSWPAIPRSRATRCTSSSSPPTCRGCPTIPRRRSRICSASCASTRATNGHPWRRSRWGGR